ncbi:hypothetical protein ES702_05028 [subsurface metagenome]
MPEMTKKEFAARLLFWLLPWPISRALPRALRIYYFGPGGAPPPGFYDYYGRPGDFWWDPYNPPPPDEIPDLPDGPINPSDPYTPGPGGSDPSHPAYPEGWTPYFDNTRWQTDDQAAWNTDHWDFLGDFAVSIKPLGTWHVGYRPTKMRITHDYGAGLELILGNDSVLGWAYNGPCVSGTEYDLDFSGDSDGDITVLEHDSGEEGCDFDITNIEFYS